MDISLAVGAQLDRLAEMIGGPRRCDGESDAVYRQRLKLYNDERLLRASEPTDRSDERPQRADGEDEWTFTTKRLAPWIEEHGLACGETLECGGTCWQEKGHESPHLCIGDDDGPGSCPA